MAVTIIANGFMGTLKQQRVSTNTTNTKLSDILNNANIIPPVTNEPNKVFSYWATTISGFDIGDYTISQLYSIGAITKDNILNIYANFTYVANSIQVTFNANGGTLPDGSTTKVITTTMGSIYGELESEISVLPTKSGSYFLKWTDPKNNVVNGSYEFTESVVITAQYSASPNTTVNVKDSRGKSVISGSFPKLTLWRDLYAKAISNGYAPDDAKKVFSAIKPGYGSYTGQAIKSIDFSVANNPMKIGWLRGSIYEAANADISLYTSRNLLPETQLMKFPYGLGSNGTASVEFSDFDATTRMMHITAPINTGQYVGVYFPQAPYNRLSPGTKAQFSMDIKGTGRFTEIGIEGPGPWIISSGISKDWNRVSSIQTASGNNNLVIYFDTSGQALDVYIKCMKLGIDGESIIYKPAPEDTNKKIRDFSATTIPVDPYATFAVTGKATNNISLTYNPIDMFDYSGNENLLAKSNTGLSGDTNQFKQILMVKDPTILSGKKLSVSMDVDYSNIKTLGSGKNRVIFELGFYDTVSKSTKYVGVSKEFTSSDIGTSFSGRITSLFDATGMVFDNRTLSSLGMYIQGVTSDQMMISDPKLEISESATEYSPSPYDNKPGLWINNDWLYNPYTQKWLDAPLDNTDYSYSNAVITFKDYFNVQYVTGDISKVRSSVTATVKSVVAGYGSTTDKKALYGNSYFPSDDSGVTLNVEEYLGYSYIVFYNPGTGYSQKIYKQAGTLYSEFLKGITKSKFEAAGKYLKGFYVSNYWESAKLIASNTINSPIDMAKSDYLLQVTSSFTTVFFNANGGVFYKGTSYETDQISVDVSKTDTYGIVSGYVPEVKKRTLGLLYWAMDLENMEPAYPNIVVDQSTVLAKWSVVDNVELYRKPREYYLIDASTIIKGWDQMNKFSISDRNNIFVIDPEGNGAAYDTSSTYTSDGWGSTEQSLDGGTLSFDAYYNGYNQYNRLGRWMRGKELAMARLDETGIPTYWMVKPAEIERTEIKYNEQYLKGKLSFTKLSPPFDLEFLGIGTDNIIDNEDDMFRRNAYVYIHSLKVPGPDNGVQIIAHNGSTTIEDSVEVDLPAGSYFEYSTIPFKERWKYGSSWSDMPNNLYNNIVNLAAARPIILGIGKWEISVSSSNIVTINSLSPHKIQDYAGKTIDSLGGLGPFMGIAIKEKEL